METNYREDPMPFLLAVSPTKYIRTGNFPISKHRKKETEQGYKTRSSSDPEKRGRERGTTVYWKRGSALFWKRTHQEQLQIVKAVLIFFRFSWVSFTFSFMFPWFDYFFFFFLHIDHSWSCVYPSQISRTVSSHFLFTPMQINAVNA